MKQRERVPRLKKMQRLPQDDLSTKVKRIKITKVLLPLEGTLHKIARADKISTAAVALQKGKTKNSKGEKVKKPYTVQKPKSIYNCLPACLPLNTTP